MAFSFVYKVKLGLQSPYKAELSLLETDKYNIWEKYLAIVGIKLEDPRHIKLDFEYKSEDMREIKVRTLSLSLSLSLSHAGDTLFLCPSLPFTFQQ